MAPIRTAASSAASPRKSILKNKSHANQAEPRPLFASSKKDKRKIKHEQLISKIAKSANPKSRRRRPNKKLVTSLDALADALPDSEDVEPTQSGSSHRVRNQINIIQRKSIKSKPGAMKRREQIDRGERDRFAKNLAQMANNNHSSSTASPMPPQTAQTEDRWKALRGFIAQTMEKKPGMGT